MTACCIGYYSTLTHNANDIQGEYPLITNDPLYQRDMTEWFIPIGDNTIYKENKPYVPSALVTEGGEISMLGKGMQKGYGCPSSICGKGVTLGDVKNKWNISKQVMMDDLPTIQDKETDIKKGGGEKHNIEVLHRKRKRANVRRPIVSDQFKVTGKKVELPASKLKKKMMHKYGKKGKGLGLSGGACKGKYKKKGGLLKRDYRKGFERMKGERHNHKTHHPTYEKRDQIKELLRRLR